MKKLFFTALLLSVAQHAASLAMTQTQAHISLFKDKIDQCYPNALQDPITEQCIKNEEEHKKTHYVLYRAHKRSIGAENYFYQQLLFALEKLNEIKYRTHALTINKLNQKQYLILKIGSELAL